MTGRRCDLPALTIDAEGWCEQALRRPSPNFDARPDDAAISLLVIHNISLPPGQFGGGFVEDLFLNRIDPSVHPYFEQLRGMRVSAHFFITRNGELMQFVSGAARAWHAGLSNFCGRERCNDFSIGVEMEGSDDCAFTDMQYEILTGLTAALRKCFPLADVAGHEHIAPSRKTDPGPFFDWEKYRRLLSLSECGEEPPLRFPR